MILFYLSIPLMLAGLALAMVPLLWAMARERRPDESPALLPEGTWAKAGTVASRAA